METESARRLLAAASVAAPSLAEALFDLTPDIVFFVKDERCRYVRVNQALVRRCGRRSKDELIGRTALEAYPPHLGATYLEQDRQVLKTGHEIRDFLEQQLSSDGSPVWCLTNKLPLRDGQGRVVGVAGWSRDLHDPEEDVRGYRELSRIVNHIRHHYAGTVRVGALIRGAGVPKSRLERLSKRIFGLTPGQLLVRTRIEAACRVLRQPGASIAAAARASGYGSHSAFTRQFKAVLGQTPRRYQQVSASRHCSEKRGGCDFSGKSAGKALTPPGVRS